MCLILSETFIVCVIELGNIRLVVTCLETFTYILLV